MAKRRKANETTRAASISELSQHVASLRDQVHELKELVCTLIAHHGCAQHRVGANPNLFRGGEERIPLESAVPMVWGKSAAKDDESLRIHTGFLKHWATEGMNSAVLETDVIDGVWYTSVDAVHRFQEKLGFCDR